MSCQSTQHYGETAHSNRVKDRVPCRTLYVMYEGWRLGDSPM